MHFDWNDLFDFTDTTSSLDDSLTNIQWLCKLESNPLLETEQKNGTGEPTCMNPYPKPPFSYATLILLAINSTSEKRMTLQDIYKWIEDNFPYYKNCKKAWKVITVLLFDKLMQIYCLSWMDDNVCKPLFNVYTWQDNQVQQCFWCFLILHKNIQSQSCNNTTNRSIWLLKSTCNSHLFCPRRVPTMC